MIKITKNSLCPLIALCVGLMISACHEQYTTYEGPSYIMFADTLTVLGVEDDTTYFEIPVAATQSANEDRTLAVEVIDKNSNAIEGVHYKLLSNTITIKAGERVANVMVCGLNSQLEISEDVEFTLQLIAPKETEWNLYEGNRTRVVLHKVCPFDLNTFTGYAVVTSTFMYNYMTVPQRLVKTEIDTTQTNTIVLRDCFYDGFDMRIRFTTDDPLNPLIEMDDQVFASTGEAFGTIYGDGYIHTYQPGAYTSYYSSCEKFVFQYMTLWVPGMAEGTNVVGTFVNAIEWVSDNEAERLKREGL